VGKIRKSIDQVSFKGDTTAPSATLMGKMVAEQTIPYGSAVYELGIKQFSCNLRDIIMKFKDADVTVILSELVSNVRGLEPFISIETDSLPRADVVYHQGQRLESEGKITSARLSYLKAKDLDALRFRATQEFNDIIRNTGSELNVQVVPMQHYFEEASPNGIVGNELVLEHLHPNIDGYFLMANAFFDAMHETKLIDAATWKSTKLKSAKSYRETWGYTELDQTYADLRIRILKGGWPFKPRTAPNRALKHYQPVSRVDSFALRTLTDENFNILRAHVQLAEGYSREGRFMEAFREYLALTKMAPLSAAAYLRAAEALINARNFNEAVPYLEKSFELKETAYANKWLGQIYLDKGEVKSALPFLEKAFKMDPQDVQLMYNLSGGYALDRQFGKAMMMLNRIDKIQPNFPGTNELRRHLENQSGLD
jgi:hypothetical protein